MTDDEEQKVTRGERCDEVMNRVMQVLTEEYQDLGPPETAFLLNWLQHRYLNEVDEIVHERSQPQPADTCTH